VMTLLLALPLLLDLEAAVLLPAIKASVLVGLVVPGETAVFVAGKTAQTGRLGPGLPQ
jgi:membrane-associated protein